MRIAVLADVHGNLAALEAVLVAARRLAPARWLVLGDHVGYGAEPSACLARLSALRGGLLIAGNHDEDVVAGVEQPGTQPEARAALRWTRARLSAAELELLRALPKRAAQLGFVAVHGSFINRASTTGYVTSSALAPNLRAVAAGGAKVGFCAHTHVPMLAWLDEAGAVHEAPVAGGGELAWSPPTRAVLVNPGSVGQPRDGDPRAAFALVDLGERRATLVRVAYDVERAARAVLAARLPPSLADRLRAGT